MTSDTEPQQDVVTVLTTDHREMFDLFGSIRGGQPGKPA